MVFPSDLARSCRRLIWADIVEEVGPFLVVLVFVGDPDKRRRDYTRKEIAQVCLGKGGKRGNRR